MFPLQKEKSELVAEICRSNPNRIVHQVNHENIWSIPKRFDFIIHWGLLYHLDNWRQDLGCALNHLKSDGYLSLESEVLDTSDDIEVKVDENLNDQSSHEWGRHSSFCNGN